VEKVTVTVVMVAVMVAIAVMTPQNDGCSQMGKSGVAKV
jgi:hypothetical protein